MLSGRPSRLLFAGLIFVTVISYVFAALHVPIYTDEIGTHLILGGYFSNPGVHRTLLPACMPPGWSGTLSVWIQPFRAIGSALYSWMPSPLGVRAFGILVLLANTVLFWINSNRLLRSQNVSWLLVIGVFGSGVTFLNWSIHRAEGWLLLAIQGVIASFFINKNNSGTGQNFTIFLSAWLFGLLAVSVHPNSIYLAPLFLLAIWSTSVHWVIRLASTGTLLFAYSNVLQYSNLLLKCEADPLLGSILQRSVTNPAKLLTDPASFLSEVFRNGAAALTYFNSLLYQDFYRYSWLPAEGLNTFQLVINIIAIVVWTGLAGLLLRNTEWRTRPMHWRIGAALGFALACVVFLQRDKLFYTSQLAVPLFFYSLMSVQKPGYPANPRVLDPCLLAIAILTFLNAFWLQFHTTSSEAWGKENLIRSTRGSLSAVVSDYDLTNRDLDELMNRCEMPKDSNLPGLVVDDLTYWKFRKSPRLMHSFYLFRSTYGQTIRSIPEFLNTYQSSGVIVRCWELSRHPELFSIVVQHRGLCCINLNTKK